MAGYRIVIDVEACDGDKLCGEIAPATFEMDDEGRARVVDPWGDPPEDILTAAQSCPLQGITLYDFDTGARVWPKG